MKCPYCGSTFSGAPQYCPNCKQPLSRAHMPSEEPTETVVTRERAPKTRRQKWLIALIAVVSVIALCLAIYKVFFWVSNYRITRLYTRGQYTPTITEVTTDDGLAGHSIVFYGEDGDQIFLPELNKSLSISGGTARITIADSEWFTGDVTDIESAIVCLTPVLIDEAGIRTQLPAMELEIEVPDSPLEIISPSEDGVSVVTSRYELELQVIAGSTVYINGSDVTDMVSRSGLLSQNVNVYPIGDNIYTLIVQTPQHHETRKEVNIYRQEFDIEVDVDSTVATVSQTSTSAVRGTIEVGASIEVETSYVEDSLIVDSETGEFVFMAKLSSFGENSVRFRVSMDGREDAVISLTIEYIPTADVYAAGAWAMDYDQLCTLYEIWNGQVFACLGDIVDTYEEEDITYLVMDVGTDDEEQLLILQNSTDGVEPTVGQYCRAYADVTGRSMYNDQYYPLLIARYIYFY